MESTQAATSGGSAASADVKGTLSPETVVPVIVQASPAANAAGEAAPKLSRSQRTAAAKAATAERTLARQPQPASRPLTPGTIVAPGLELSPVAASMSPGEVMASFLGKPVEQAPEEATKEETETTVEDTASTAADTSTETETETDAEAEQADAETETETSVELTGTPVDGIVKAMAKFPELKGLSKRVTEVFQQNAERGERLKQLEAQAPVVLSPTPDHPFSHLKQADEVDTAVQTTVADARSKLRWLNRHLDGGTWDEGTDNPVDMDANAVENAIRYYEQVTDQAGKWGDQRKQFLTRQAEIASALEMPVSELISPKVATRESQLIREVPSLLNHPEYLQILADAQAGRTAREEKARGVKTVKVDPDKAKTSTSSTPSKSGRSVAASTSTSSTAASAAKGATIPVRSPNADIPLDQLRELANAGNQAAQTELARRFLRAA